MNTLKKVFVTVIGQTGASGPMTVPGVLAALTQDVITGFPALRAHQRHAWHSFLVLLAANALHRAGLTEPPESEDAWRDLLRA